MPHCTIAPARAILGDGPAEGWSDAPDPRGRDHPDLPADSRARFTRIVLDEGRRLHARIEALLESGLRAGLIR
jgi:hypothetical protein